MIESNSGIIENKIFIAHIHYQEIYKKKCLQSSSNKIILVLYERSRI